jgi:hypothetical protein
VPSQAEVIQALRNASNGRDMAVPPPTSPADVVAGATPFANALGLPDALKALKGQLTPEEAQTFALTSAMGLLPGAKAETAVAKGVGSLAGKSTLTDLGKAAWQAAKANDFQPLARIGQQNVVPKAYGAGEPMVDTLNEAFSKNDWEDAAKKMGPPDFNEYQANYPGPFFSHEGMPNISPTNQQYLDYIKTHFPNDYDAELKSTALAYPSQTHPFGTVVPPDVSEGAINEALAKNPGASIFDIAGTNVEGPSAQWPKKPSPIGEDNPQVEIKNLSPEENAARFQRMQQDYPDRVYHGVMPGKTFEGPSVRNNDYLYMASNPELANLYAGVHGNQPYRGAPPLGQVVPLQADLSKFHTYDARGTPASSGELWTQVNADAIRQAREKGAPGVTIKNVFDEPASTKYLGDPQTIHILMDKNWNKNQDKFPLRSPFAMFDPSQYSANNLLAGLAGGAVAAPAVTPQVQEYIKALQGNGGQQDQ